MAQAQLTRFQGAEFARMNYVYTVEAGTPYDALFEPSYWAHVAGDRQIRAFDIFEIRPDEGTYFAELLVIEVDRASVRVLEIRHVDLTKAKKSAPLNAAAGLFVQWAGPHDKFRVVRPPSKPGESNAVMKSGFVDKDSAQAWLAENRKSLAAA